MLQAVLGFWRRLPLVGRLLIPASAALLVAGALMLYSTVWEEAGEARADLQGQLKDELQTLPSALGDLLVIGDYASLQQALNRRVRQPRIIRLRYLDASGAKLESDGHAVPPRHSLPPCGGGSGRGGPPHDFGRLGPNDGVVG